MVLILLVSINQGMNTFKQKECHTLLIHLVWVQHYIWGYPIVILF